jgi:hypothetical protein
MRESVKRPNKTYPNSERVEPVLRLANSRVSGQEHEQENKK